MTATQGVPIARIPAGQSVDLFTAVGHLLDTALGGAMLAQGNGHDVAATVVAREGQTERQAVTALRRAAEALGAEDLAPLVDDELDEDGPGVTVGPLRHDERGWTASLGGTAVELARQVMAVLVPAFEEHPEAMNYLCWDATYGPTGQRYSLILVRPNGLTPHEARQRAEQELERVRAEHVQAVEDWGCNDEQVLAENQRLADQVADATALVDDLLGMFAMGEKDHPGRPCVRTGWIDETALARLRERRATLAAPVSMLAPDPAWPYREGTYDLANLPSSSSLPQEGGTDD